MTVSVSVRELVDKRVWDRVADLKGINLWALNEGQILEEELIELTYEEAVSIGLFKEVK